MVLLNQVIAQATPSPQLSSQGGANHWASSTNFLLLVTLAVNIFSIYKGREELKNQRKLFIENQSLKERDDIRYRLNNFFGPMRQLRIESKIFYDVFALEEKEEASRNNSYFRTVQHLTNEKSFSEQDKALLGEIVEIGKKQLALIEKEGWAVTNFHLTELLGQLAAHIRILVMAHDFKLKGMSGALEKVLFPLEIDGALETEVRKLQDRYTALLRETKDKNSPVDIDEGQRRTIAYYDKNYLNYYKQTAFIDLSDIYHEFKGHVPRGALILDAGCGVGRDTRYFIKHGYKVVAFDASHGMVKMCRQYPFAYCLHRSFEQISFVEEFDAVWACASLIHLSWENLCEALFRLFNALKPGGYIYFSLKINDKYGVTDQVSAGRQFYYYSDDAIVKLANEDLALELIKKWTNRSKKESDTSDWTNFLYRKPRGTPQVKGISQ